MEIIKSSLSAAEPSLKDRVVNPGATFGPSNIKQLSQEISRDPVKFSELQEAVAELSAKQAEQSPEERSPSETVKLGVCEYLVGDYDAAVQTLAEKNDGDALNPFYRAKIALRLGRNEDAIACFNKAEKAGYPKGDCALAGSVALREGDRCFNRFFFVKPDGTVTQYDKRHLFTVDRSEEPVQ